MMNLFLAEQENLTIDRLISLQRDLEFHVSTNNHLRIKGETSYSRLNFSLSSRRTPPHESDSHANAYGYSARPEIKEEYQRPPEYAHHVEVSSVCFLYYTNSFSHHLL